MRDELFRRFRSEKSATRSICLGSRLPTIQPKRPKGLPMSAIYSLKSSGCRDRSILILATAALHPSGISCNNIPKSRNSRRSRRSEVLQIGLQRTRIIFHGCKTCQRNRARISSGSPPGSVYHGGPAYSTEHSCNWSYITSPESLAMSVLDLRGWRGDGIIAALNTPSEAACVKHLNAPVVNISGTLPKTPGAAGEPRQRHGRAAGGRAFAGTRIRNICLFWTAGCRLFGGTPECV